MNKTIRAIILLSCTASIGILFQNCAKKNPTETTQSSVANSDGGINNPLNVDTSATNVCDIHGGGGLQLAPPTRLSQANCSSACSGFAPTHPNLICLWGSADLAAVDTCTITGGGGLALFSQSVSHGACTIQCNSLAATHPNLSCMFEGNDLAPSGQCSVIGGGGLVLMNTTNTRGACVKYCLSQLSVHPNEACLWQGASLL